MESNQKVKVKRSKEADGTITLTLDNPKYSLIWLHGLGDSSSGFLDFFTSLKQSPLFHGARVILLQAPSRPVTVNGGLKANSWYDMKILDRTRFASMSDQELFSIPQMRQSAAIVQSKVDKEIEFWKIQKLESKVDPYSRIFVGGFSQGCATSLFYGLQCAKPIAGIVGYSGHMLRSIQLKNLESTPIILFHGAEDTLLFQADCKKSYERILNHKNVKYSVIPDMGHSVDVDELIETEKWLNQRTNNLD